MTEFAKGDRVELHPATDAWMMGDRYGTVVRVGPYVEESLAPGQTIVVRVRMDRSGRMLKCHPDYLTIIDTPNRERDDG